MISTVSILFLFISIFNNNIIFSRMARVVVFIMYNSHWEQNNLKIDHKTMSVLVTIGTIYIAEVQFS